MKLKLLVLTVVPTIAFLGGAALALTPLQQLWKDFDQTAIKLEKLCKQIDRTSMHPKFKTHHRFTKYCIKPNVVTLTEQDKGFVPGDMNTFDTTTDNKIPIPTGKLLLIYPTTGRAVLIPSGELTLIDTSTGTPYYTSQENLISDIFK